MRNIMSKETIDKTFNIDAPARLTLSNICGSVEILPGEDNIIHVTAVKQIRSGANDQTKIAITQIDSHHVSVKTNYRNGWKNFSTRKPCNVEYKVRVPKACSLKLSGVSNTIAVQGVEGEMGLKTVSGPVTLEDISGSIKIDSVSGKISGKQITGPLAFNTVSGKIHIHASHFPSIDGHTVSGNISIQTPCAEGPYNFNSVSGDIEFIVPSDSTISASLKSISGRIKTQLTTTSSHINGGNSRLEIQGGGVEVRVRSVSGSLYLTHSNETNIEEMDNSITLNPEEHSSHPHDKPPSTESNMKILDRISAGELSVDEAIEKIS